MTHFWLEAGETAELTAALTVSPMALLLGQPSSNEILYKSFCSHFDGKRKENQQRNLQESKHKTKCGLGFLKISLFEGVMGLERVWALNSNDSFGMATVY